MRGGWPVASRHFPTSRLASEGAGGDAEQFLHQAGRSEREAPGAELVMQRLEFDRRILRRHDQEHAVALVFQEQVLGVRTGNRAAQLARLLDGEQRRMGRGLVRDPVAVEEREQVIGRGWHRDPSRWNCGYNYE